MNAQEKPRVLIVEDNSLISEVIKGLLEEAGYTVVGEAADGLEAVEMTQSLRPDVILMDIRMPIMDGIEATRLIYERFPTPVVVLTAYDTPELVERASAAGAGAYLVKPPNVREMEHAITTTIARFGDMMELRRLNAELQAEITERKRAEEALRRRNEELAALNTITAAVSQSLDLKEILNAALEETLAVLNAKGGVMYLFDETSQTFAPAVHRGLSQDVLREATGFKLGEGLSGRAAQTGQPLLVPDLAKDLRNISPTSVKEGWQSLVSVPLKVKGRTVGVMTIASRVKDRFTPDSLSLLTAIGNQIGVAIENARLHEETMRRLKEAETFGAVTTALTRSLDLDQVLQSIVDSAARLIPASTSGVIHLVDEAAGKLIPRATLAPEVNIREKLEMPIGEGIAGLVVQAKRLINVPNVEEDPRFLTIDTPTPKKSLLTAPLLIDGDCIGTLSLNSDQVGAFSADDERLLTTLAAQAAVAVRNARLFEQAQREIAERKRAEEEVTKHRRDLQSLSAQLINAQEAERKRISRELHDEMGQALTAMSINLAAIEKELLPELSPMIRERLAETSSLADQTLEQVRELSLDLRPSMLDDLGLLPTLRWYVNRYAKRLDIEVEFEAIDFEERLAAEVETALYRVVQEALTNAARHAQANRVRIRLEREESTVAGLIEDDGQGFNVEEVAGRETSERGAGLLGIRERVASLGGRFRIQSRPGQGTRLSLEIPIADCGLRIAD
jgi:signal transduction histidine kinase/AmiR/NasT family two-component response regulator